MTPPEVFLGKAVVDGKVQFWSVSSLDKGDTEREGCLRKWHFRYVMGIKEPEKPWLKAGDEFHKQAENYLRSGNRGACSPLLLSGIHLMPNPGPDLLLEHVIPLQRVGEGVHVKTFDDGTSKIVGGTLIGRFNIVGIPLFGKRDCVSQRDQYLTEEGELHDEAPGTVEVSDWKTVSDWKYHKQNRQLPELLQLVGYAACTAEEFDAQRVRLTHVGFLKKKREARRSTIAIDRESIAPRFARIEGIARTLINVACETDPLKVDANTNVCSAYGGCPYRGECPASRERTLLDMFGPGMNRDRKELTMSLDLIERLKQQSAANNPALAALTTPTPPPAPAVPPGFAEAIRILDQSAYGRPSLTGAAAQAYATMSAQQYVPGTAYPATGQVWQQAVDTVEQLISVGQEVAKVVAATPAPLPPDAPKSDPALAAIPVEGELPPGVVNPAPVEEKKKKASKKAATLPAVASGNAGTVAPAAPVITQGQVFIPAGTPIPALPDSGPIALYTPPPAPVGLQIFVDCMVSAQLPSLDSMVDACVAKLQQLGGVADIRLAPNDNPLGFGKWKAGLALAVKEEAAKLAPGSYVMSGYGELRATAAEALSSVASLFVRGGR